MRNKIFKRIALVAFILYGLILIYTTFFGARTTLTGVSVWEYAVRMANIKPFKTIGMYAKRLGDPSDQMFSVALVNLAVNIVLFFPMAYLLPVLFTKLRHFFATIGVCVGVLVVIEIMQILTRRGSFDVDDFILNMIGAVVGYGAWKLQYVIAKKKKGNTIFDEVE